MADTNQWSVNLSRLSPEWKRAVWAHLKQYHPGYIEWFNDPLCKELAAAPLFGEPCLPLHLFPDDWRAAFVEQDALNDERRVRVEYG